MILRANTGDITYTSAVSGVPGNFLAESLQLTGVDINKPGSTANIGAELAGHADDHQGSKAWRDVWSAGQGVAGIEDVPTVAELVSRLQNEFGLSSSRLANQAD